MYEKGKHGSSNKRDAKWSGTINSMRRRSGESHFTRKTVLTGIKGNHLVSTVIRSGSLDFISGSQC